MKHPVPEVASSIEEDPAFRETLGRARARARRQQYDPELHDPYLVRTDYEPTAEASEGVRAIIEEWSSRGGRRSPYMRGAA